MTPSPSRTRNRERRNHYSRPIKKDLTKRLAEHAHCSVHADEKVIILKTIERLELLEHLNEVLEEQIRTLILASLKKEFCPN